MIKIDNFIAGFSNHFINQPNWQPWQITQALPQIIEDLIAQAGNNFEIKNGIAIHPTAIVESGAILKAPGFIGENCHIGSNAYLRGGVYLAPGARIGPGCEIKSSIIFGYSSIAHFNYIGDSIIGNKVNIEAGAILANHYNEKENKDIIIFYEGNKINTGSQKFGALIGDNCRIGANAVLSPGTILRPGIIVKRLELVDQQELYMRDELT